MDKGVIVKHQKPTASDFLYLFESVGWERSLDRIKQNLDNSCFVVSVYKNDNIVAMGRVVGDGAYFTIYDIVLIANIMAKDLGR